ncbi:UvrD-helicase domain-containing protein [Pseudomonas sp. LB3P93]
MRALAARYPQLLVDESQDLGTLHQAILELLIKAGVHVSLIGDVNQGIYGFAGADGSFLSTYYNRAGVKDFKLTRNYRSLPPIITIANSLCGREDEADREPENGGAYFVGYVAVTRARNLFWLAVPHTCLKALRPNLIAAGFEEVPARK